jgi:hypothetical protein
MLAYMLNMTHTTFAPKHFKSARAANAMARSQQVTNRISQHCIFTRQAANGHRETTTTDDFRLTCSVLGF